MLDRKTQHGIFRILARLLPPPVTFRELRAVRRNLAAFFSQTT